MADSYDAIIVGAGHNGLVCALYLARAGWKTLVLERNEEVGGAVMSGEVTLSGFTHDLYSTNQNLFLGSPAYAELASDLERHGLYYKTSEKPYASVFPEGKSLRVYSDLECTLDLLRQHSSEDAKGFSHLYEKYKVFTRTLLPLYSTPLPSTQAAMALIRAVKARGIGEISELTRIVLSSTRELGNAYFATREMKALLATWGLHLDFGPEVSGGAMFPFLETFTDMENGMSVVEGGASRMPEALASLLREHGGEIRTGCEVRLILTEDGRAVGVELASGERLAAERAVVANLTPTALFERLLPNEPLPATFREKVEAYQHGPGTMMIHLALSEKPRWAAGEELDEFAYIHIAPYLEELAQTYTESLNGLLPASPVLIVGQTSAVDPSRAPEGGQVMWIQVRTLPSEIKGDAAGEISARNWEEAREPFAERVMDKLESYAPGIRDLVRGRIILSPQDLECHNPNLSGGDSVSGSHHLRQNFVFRPFPGWSRYRMPVEGLYMTGAATWPGGGVNATSGYLAAQEILRSQKRRKNLTFAGAGAAAGVTAMVIALRKLHKSRSQDG